MHPDQVDQEQPVAPDRDRQAADANAPRGNPDPERESVRRAEEQLDRVSGN